MPITSSENVTNVQIIIEHHQIRRVGKKERRTNVIRVIRESIWFRSERISR